MNTFAIVIALLVPSQCRQGQCVQQVQKVQAVQQVVAQPYVAAATVAYTDPYWTYVVGQDQELRSNKNVEKLIEQNQQLIALLAECHKNGGGPPAIGNSPLDDAAEQIIAKNCLSCHSGESPKGHVRFDSEVFDLATRLSIVNEVEHGRMPPAPAPVLADSDFQTLKQWANQDPAAVRSLLRQNRAVPVPSPPQPVGPTSSRPAEEFLRSPSFRPVSVVMPRTLRDVPGVADTRLKEPPR